MLRCLYNSSVGVKYKMIKMLTYTSFKHIQGPNRIFWGGAQVEDVPHIIYKVVFGGVLLSLCRSVRVQETTQQPPTPNRGSLGHGRAPQRCGVSREGKYLCSIP